MKRTAIIGNAPEFDGSAYDLDAYDHIVRFNNTAGLGTRAGGRTDELLLVSRGGQPAEWLADPGFVERRAVRDATQITLVFPPSTKSEDECHAHGLIGRLTPLGKIIGWIDAETEARARAALIGHGGNPKAALSSGYLYTFRLLEAGSASAPHVFGFGFEGWDGHAWAAERAWFEASHDAGRLVLHPLNRREG
ncbi:hypothetical protein ACLE20_02740 [Rhizobium sp. YIM 134829]|uniref:hypothetical protein n=1 Tax=Rhizobium sp. YIM 134829 TaxID=3390453 RepID=UPI00397C2EDA